MLKSAEPMDMGPVDLWAMAQKVEMPLYQMASFGGKNTIMVDNAKGEYKWQVPVTQDLPYIIEDIEGGNTSKGIDGTTFKIKVNKRAFGHGDIITYDKYNGAEMYITAEDILPAGDGFIYTVQLVNNDNVKFLSTVSVSLTSESLVLDSVSSTTSLEVQKLTYTTASLAVLT